MIEGESEVAGLAVSCHTSAQCTPRPDGVQVARPQIIFSIHIQSYLVVKTLNTRPLTALCLSRSVQSPCLKVSSLTTFSTLNKVCEEQQLTCIVYVISYQDTYLGVKISLPDSLVIYWQVPVIR